MMSMKWNSTQPNTLQEGKPSFLPKRPLTGVSAQRSSRLSQKCNQQNGSSVRLSTEPADTNYKKLSLKSATNLRKGRGGEAKQMQDPDSALPYPKQNISGVKKPTKEKEVALSKNSSSTVKQMKLANPQEPFSKEISNFYLRSTESIGKSSNKNKSFSKQSFLSQNSKLDPKHHPENAQMGQIPLNNHLHAAEEAENACTPTFNELDNDRSWSDKKFLEKDASQPAPKNKPQNQKIKSLFLPQSQKKSQHKSSSQIKKEEPQLRYSYRDPSSLVKTPNSSLKSLQDLNLKRIKQLSSKSGNSAQQFFKFSPQTSKSWQNKSRRMHNKSHNKSQSHQRDSTSFKPKQSIKLVNPFSQELVQLRILSLIEKNGRNTIYLVVEKKTKFVFCLKKCSIGRKKEPNYFTQKQKNKPESIQDQGLTDAIRQAKIALALNHPNLLQTYAVLVDDSNLYILMEYMEGQTLLHKNKSDFQKQESPLANSSSSKVNQIQRSISARRTLDQLVRGVQYLHQMGIIHRDIKPSNIFVCQGNHFKLGDFGSATFTKSQEHIGTLDYAAPEIMLHKQYDKEVDMWSIGCVAYEIFTGRPPFYHKSEEITTKRIVNCEYDLSQILDQKLKDLIGKLLLINGSSRLNCQQILEHPFLLQYLQRNTRG